MQHFQTRILWSVIGAFCIWGAIGVLTGALLPDIMATFTLSATQAGILISFWSISFVAGSWISARVIKNYPLNTIFVVASTISLAAMCLLFLSESLWFFTPAFGVVGAMMGISVTIGHSLIGMGFPEKRTSMLSALDVVFTLGSMAAPLGVIALASGGMDWQFFYLFLGLAFAILIAVLISYLPSVSAPKSEHQTEGNGYKQYFGSSFLVFLGLTGLMLGTVEWAQNSWIVTFALDQGSSVFSAQMGMATYLGGMLFVRILTIFVSGWMQRGYNSTCLLLVALLGNLLLLYGTGDISFLLGNFLIGAGIGALFPIALGRAMDFNPKDAAISSATLLMGVISGSQIAALFLGWLADYSGSIGEAFKATTSFFVLLIIFYSAFRSKSTQQESECPQQPSQSHQ